MFCDICIVSQQTIVNSALNLTRDDPRLLFIVHLLLFCISNEESLETSRSMYLMNIEDVVVVVVAYFNVPQQTWKVIIIIRSFEV